MQSDTGQIKQDDCTAEHSAMTQVPAFLGYKNAQAASLAGVIVCLTTLVAYCIFQALPPPQLT